jgi:hypothetical protein
MVRNATLKPMKADDVCYLALYPECPEPGDYYKWSLDLDFLDVKPIPQEPQPPAVSTHFSKKKKKASVQRKHNLHYPRS